MFFTLNWRLAGFATTGFATMLCLEFVGVYIFGGISGNCWIYGQELGGDGREEFVATLEVDITTALV